MPITSVTRWKMDRNQGAKLAAEAVPLLKRLGATSVRVGYCFAGQYIGQTMVVVNYSDWEAYGKSQAAQAQDSAYQTLFSKVLGEGELLDRSLIVMTDL